ncbi:MAG: hypothetical protein AMXMBFR56_04140 [Polyangiaceae bacterium]
MGAALAACGDDDDGGGSGGSGGGATGGSGGGGTGGSATGGSAGTSTGGTAGTSTGGTAGMDGGAGTDGGGNAADTFCASYETKCTFTGTDHYTSSADCKTKYNGFNTATKACVEQHLGMADSATSVHCTHATGIAPCNL